MIKGPGRSACFRGGVTYGYRECLRKGRVRKKLLRKFVVRSWHDGLAKSLKGRSTAKATRSISLRYPLLSHPLPETAFPAFDA